MSIGVNIKRLRTARGMTQKEMAERIQVDPSMVCQIERGTKTPSLPLGRCLGVPIEELLAEDERG